MAPLGALSQAWTSAEASLPLGWQVSGLYLFDDLGPLQDIGSSVAAYLPT